jgi:hypothetical protein
MHTDVYQRRLFCFSAMARSIKIADLADLCCTVHHGDVLAIACMLICRVGQNHKYLRCIYGIIGRLFTKYTVIYGVYIRFWPTLLIWLPHRCFEIAERWVTAGSHGGRSHCNTQKSDNVESSFYCCCPFFYF